MFLEIIKIKNEKNQKSLKFTLCLQTQMVPGQVNQSSLLTRSNHLTTFFLFLSRKPLFFKFFGTQKF